MLRLLWLLLVLYLLWQLYLLLIKPKRALARSSLRVRPEMPLTPIYYVSGAEGFRQLHDAPKQEGDAPLTLLEHGTLCEGEAAYVLGSVQNTSAQGFKAVEVAIGFYDERGGALSQVSAQHDRLGAGDVWTFRARVTRPQAAKYRILELKGSPLE